MAQWAGAISLVVVVASAVWRYTIVAERRFTRLEEEVARARGDIQNLFLALPKRSGDYFRIGGQ